MRMRINPLLSMHHTLLLPWREKTQPILSENEGMRGNLSPYPKTHNLVHRTPATLSSLTFPPISPKIQKRNDGK